MEKALQIDATCFAVDNDDLWFVPQKNYFYGLYKMSLSDDKVVCLAQLPCDEEGLKKGRPQYGVLAKVGDKVIIAPRFIKKHSDFLEFDTNNGTFDEISLDVPYIDSPFVDSKQAYDLVVNYHDKAFFICSFNGYIVEYNGNSKSYKIHTRWSDDVEDIIPKRKLFFNRDSFVVKDHYLYLTPYETNKIVIIDLDIMRSDVVEMPFEFKSLSLVAMNDNVIVLSADGDDIVFWNPAINEFKKIELPTDNSLYPRFFGGVTYGDNQVLFPCYGNKILTINPRNGISSVDIMDFLSENDETGIEMPSKYFRFPVITHDILNNRCFVLHSRQGILYEVDCVNGRVKQHKKNTMEDNEVELYIKSGMRQNEILPEMSQRSLPVFIKCIINLEFALDKIDREHSENIGENIYSMVLEGVK
ncbi:hypothetical protein [Selenomonas sp. AB3002]|uniref:hypothetical protein n=1 Tax=Selenomonas sp. AB3002 TaxID=1392502 RepID=UPI000496E585